MIRMTWNHRIAADNLKDPNGVPWSLQKPSLVLREVADFVDLLQAPPADEEELVRAHSLAYVNGIFAGRKLNGFGNTERYIADQARGAVGCMIEACRLALDKTGPVLAPVSGFHHAHYDRSSGYCTFNGLLVAIAVIRLTQALPRVLIIDGDAHFGDGTADIMNRLGTRGIANLTHGRNFFNNLTPENWERALSAALNQEWDLVIYQAGADAFKEDSYGSGYLSEDDWDRRDELVFKACAERRIPCAFNLAGGYNGQKTIQLHARTARTANNVYARFKAPQAQA